MQTLRIPAELMSDMVTYVRDHRPNEACGLLAGHEGIVQAVIPITNVSKTPTWHYQMSPNALLKAMKQIDTDGIELLGTFHSHPTSSPIPSDTDVHDAMQNTPNIMHLIVGLRYPKAEIQAWQMQDYSAEKVELLVENAKLENIAPMSETQKWAFVLMTVIAVMLLISVSITLLPPAPPLPT